MSDYFIHNETINAYTINAFAEAIVEATNKGLVLNFDSARRIGSSFSISIVSQEETVVETEETPADQAQSIETQSADESSEETEQPEDESVEQTVDKPELGDTEVPPFTLEDIEAAKDSMKELNKLGDPVGVSARSKKEMVKLLKEYIGEA